MTAKNSPLQDAKGNLIKRLESVLGREIAGIDDAEVMAMNQLDDHQVLAQLVEHNLLKQADYSPDRRARMALKAIKRFQQLIKETGGAYTLDELAVITGRTPAALRKDAERKNVLMFKHDGQALFPVSQVEGDKIVAGIRKVLEALPGEMITRDRIRFMLKSVDTEHHTPLDLLKQGQVERATQLAALEGYQIAT